MKIPNTHAHHKQDKLSLARIVSEDSQLMFVIVIGIIKSSKDS